MYWKVTQKKLRCFRHHSRNQCKLNDLETKLIFNLKLKSNLFRAPHQPINLVYQWFLGYDLKEHFNSVDSADKHFLSASNAQH